MARADQGGTSWVLFLDESGQFERVTEPVCIAGLLLQEQRWSAMKPLRREIARANPLVPYPPHATDLNLAATHLALWQLATLGAQQGHPFARQFRSAAGALRSLAAPPVRRFHQGVARGRLPRWDDLASVNMLLQRGHARCFAELGAVVDWSDEAYVSVIHNLRETYGDERCFVVAAADHGAFDESDSPAEDRYLELLVVLLERVFALLRTRPPARHFVAVVPAVRDVMGVAGVPAPLSQADVERCIARATRFPLDPPSDGPDEYVRMNAEIPQEYDERVAPGIVLADLVANRLNRLAAARPPWGQLGRETISRTGLRIEATPRVQPDAAPHPTLAADGEARRIIGQAFELVCVERATSAAATIGTATVPAGWERDQAQSWVKLACYL
jgi:hypothetical protein